MSLIYRNTAEKEEREQSIRRTPGLLPWLTLEDGNRSISDPIVKTVMPSSFSCSYFFSHKSRETENFGKISVNGNSK